MVYSKTIFGFFLKFPFTVIYKTADKDTQHNGVSVYTSFQLSAQMTIILPYQKSLSTQYRYDVERELKGLMQGNITPPTN